MSEPLTFAKLHEAQARIGVPPTMATVYCSPHTFASLAATLPYSPDQAVRPTTCCGVPVIQDEFMPDGFVVGVDIAGEVVKIFDLREEQQP